MFLLLEILKRCDILYRLVEICSQHLFT